MGDWCHRLRYEPPSMPVRSSTQRSSRSVWAARRTEHLKNWSGTQPLALLHAANGSERFAVTVRGQWLCRRPRELQIQLVARHRNQDPARRGRRIPATSSFVRWPPACRQIPPQLDRKRFAALAWREHDAVLTERRRLLAHADRSHAFPRSLQVNPFRGGSRQIADPSAACGIADSGAPKG